MASEGYAKPLEAEPDALNPFKEMGVSLLSSIAADLGPDDVGLLAEPLEAVVRDLESLPACSLFKEWAPRRSERMCEVRGLSGSSASPLTSGSAHSVLGSDSSFFMWSTGTTPFTWTAVGKGASADALEIHWRGTDAAESVEVHLGKDEESLTLFKEYPFEGKKQVLRFGEPQDVLAIKLVIKNFKDSSKKAIGMSQVRLLAIDTELSVESSQTMRDITSLFSLAAASGDEAVQRLGITGLQALARATGSLGSLLRLVTASLKADTAKVDGGDSRRVAAALMASVAQQSDKAVEEAMGGGAQGKLEPEFDPAFKTDDVNLSEDNTVASSTSSSKAYAYGTIGFSSGRGSWEMKVERDSQGDECCCFGFGTKPVTNVSYDSSPNMYMIRSYMGTPYQAGVAQPFCTKIHPNDMVRFEVDCDAGEATLFVNDVSFGVVFREFAGKEIFPCAGFYSSNRAVRFTAISKEGAGNAEGAVDLSTTEPMDYSRGVSWEGKLDDDTDIRVDGNPCKASMTVAPDASGADGKATYNLTTMDNPMETLVGTIKVDDSTAEDARACIVEVQADGKVLYSSPPLQKRGDEAFMRVFVNDKTSLTIVSRLADPEASKDSPVALTVITSPSLQPKRDWASADLTPCGPDAPRMDIPGPDADLDYKGVALVTLRALHGAVLGDLAKFAKLAARIADPTTSPEERAKGSQLESAYTTEVTASVFELLHELLATFLKRGPVDDSSAALVLAAVDIARINLGRLVQANVDPALVGVALTGPNPTLKPLHEDLKSLLADDMPMNLKMAASSAIHAGLPVLYPTDEDRRQLLRELVIDGAVVEVQARFPTYKPKDKTKKDDQGDTVDTRFERLLLLLQVEAEAYGWRASVVGEWKKYNNLLIEIPSGQADDAYAFLDGAVARAYKRCGFGAWGIPVGSKDPLTPLQIERFVDLKKLNVRFTDNRMAVMRIYPKSAGTYDEVAPAIAKSIKAMDEEPQPGKKKDSEGGGGGGGGGARRRGGSGSSSDSEDHGFDLFGGSDDSDESDESD